MKFIKYALTTIIIAVIYMLFMFMTPMISIMFGMNLRVAMYIVLGLVLAGEYLVLWYKDIGRFYSIPISFLMIILSGLFYFNHPENAELNFGMWVLVTKLILPYAVGGLIVSTVLHFIKRKKC